MIESEASVKGRVVAEMLSHFTNDALSDIGGGGGHAEMAGGFVSFASGTSRRKISLMIEHIEERFLAAIGNNNKKSER